MRRKILPLNALRVLEAAARHQSFALAAQELNVTPGAVSQQIKSLEEYLGQPLFEKNGRGIRPTSHVLLAMKHLTTGLEEFERAAQLLQSRIVSRRLNVAVAPSFASKWLIPRLEQFHAQHPNLEVYISAGLALTEFTNEGPDLAIRYGAGHYPGLVSEKLMTETILPVAAPEFVARYGISASRVELLEELTLIHDDSDQNDPTCPTWPMWFAARGLNPTKARGGLRFNQSSLALEAALAGQGVVLAKRAIAQADLIEGNLVAPFADGTADVSFAYWICWPQHQEVSQSGSDFCDWLKGEARQHELTLGEL